LIANDPKVKTLLAINWESLFIPSGSVLEIIARGSLMYLLLFFLMRILRRQSGAISISDVLVIVLIADAAQNAMANEYKSFTEGAILVMTLFFWDYFLDWLGYYFQWIRPILRPSALALIKDGEPQGKNLRQEMITLEELTGQLRRQGVENISEVKSCYLEADGHISVVKANDHPIFSNKKS
jgi:uncharacterized membrane protein YcaP (DUF421 family)